METKEVRRQKEKRNPWRSARCTRDKVSTAGAESGAKTAGERPGRPGGCHGPVSVQDLRHAGGAAVRRASGSAQALPGEAGGTGDVGVAAGIGDDDLHAGDPDL